MYLQVLLGLSPYNADFSDLEPLFVGFDIEASRRQRHVAHHDPTHRPLITEVGLAILDSRDLARDMMSSPKTLIRSESFKVRADDGEPADDSELADNSVCLSGVAATVRHAIEVVDDKSQDNRLRNVVIVGHSPQGDLTMLKNLGFDLDNSATRYRVLDTHCLANKILPKCIEPEKKVEWTLKGVMERLGCVFDYKSFHDGDNDAHHHLNVMVKLGFCAFDDNDQNQATQSQQTPEQANRDGLQEWYKVQFCNNL